MKKTKLMLRNKITHEYRSVSCLHVYHKYSVYPIKSVDKNIKFNNISYGTYYGNGKSVYNHSDANNEFELVATFNGYPDEIIDNFTFICRDKESQNVKDKLSDDVYVHCNNVDIINLGNKMLVPSIISRNITDSEKLWKFKKLINMFNYSKRGTVCLRLVNEKHQEMDWEIIY